MIDTKRVDKLLLEEERQIIIRRGKIASSMMAVPLVLSFTFVDYFFAPDLISEFFKVRLIIIPVAILAFFLYRLKIVQEKFIALPAYLVCGFLVVYNSYLVMMTGAEKSAYYAGLNLVAIGGVYFLPLSIAQLNILILCIFSPYFLLIFASGNPLDYSIFITHSAFMSSTAALCMLVNIFNRKLRRSEIEAKIMLEDEIQSKEQIIKEKTKEGVYLQKLTTQFSPQVVSAIKSGALSLDYKKRVEVSCIFIDIENSTSRASKLDHDVYSKLVSDFFSDCISILLKHDVTIGTYLGDGLLAFTNAPQKQDQHEKKALMACIEILENHSIKRRYYNDQWRVDFNIRIGIDSGFSYVGFYPNEKHGTYTAVGETVNLASRLCSKASSNTICARKEFIKKSCVDISDVDVTKLDRVNDIKGYEGENFDLYLLKKTDSIIENNSEVCPLCKSKMTTISDLGHASLKKCVSCQYTDLVDKDEDNSDLKKAS